jgi:hypothetical protein
MLKHELPKKAVQPASYLTKKVLVKLVGLSI